MSKLFKVSMIFVIVPHSSLVLLNTVLMGFLILKDKLFKEFDILIKPSYVFFYKIA